MNYDYFRKMHRACQASLFRCARLRAEFRGRNVVPSKSASRIASRIASNAGLDEFFPTRWCVVIEYSAT
jgi:hypothetical protein